MTGSSEHRKPHSFYVGVLIILTLWMSLPGIARMQVIDRDEARYAQATVQMVESGDYINIRFQDRARNKKPAGIYWMQAAFVKAFTEPGERKIWTHRIVSVIGALLAVLATYWGALVVLGRRAAFWSGAILATTLLMAFEAHIAKTDAMLCGFSALALACLLRLQKNDKPGTALIFWLAIGGATMVKGPIVPAIVIITLLTYVLWRRDAAWLKSLIHVPGIVIALLIILPWAITIGIATDGAFFKEAIGGDLAPKIAGGQESHGALPGYYLLTLPIFFWPGILFLLPGLVFAWKVARKAVSDDDNLRKAVSLLICWVVPFWIILELVPTKLPNYPLPLYPALAILSAAAFSAMLSMDGFKISRRLSAMLFAIVGIVVTAGVFSADGLYADNPSPVVYGLPIAIGLAFAGAMFMWRGQAQRALIAGLIFTGLLTPLTYGHIFPRLDDLRLSNDIAEKLPETRGRLISPNFTEPSLVYRAGTNILLGDKADAAINAGLKRNDFILIDEKEADDRHRFSYLKSLVKDPDHCLSEQAQIDGRNYSKGNPVELKLYQVKDCETITRP